MKILSSRGQKTNSDTTSSVPFGLTKHLYPFGTPEYRRDDHGNYLAQKMEAADFTLYFFRFEIIDTVTLFPWIEHPVIAFNLMLQGNIPAQLTGYGKRMLEENECEMFYLTAGETEVTLEKGLYQSCYLEVAPALISPIAEKHQAIKLLCNKLIEGDKKSQPSIQVKINGEVKNLLKEMRTDHQVGPEQTEVLLRAAVYKLLSYYKSSVERLEHITAMVLSGMEQKLIQIQQYIMQNANIHECSLHKLSVMFHIPKDTLKVNFKKRFMVTVFQFLQSQCMERAKELLLFNDTSVSDIAIDLGYSNLFNFSNAFKKHYGISPLQMKNYKGDDEAR
jgi:AraC-like DNA-binding protein